jgi:hypothetical protein
MHTALTLAALVAVWYAVNRYIFPRLGIRS